MNAESMIALGQSISAKRKGRQEVPTTAEFRNYKLGLRSSMLSASMTMMQLFSKTWIMRSSWNL